jgi:hypothetical protein
VGHHDLVSRWSKVAEIHYSRLLVKLKSFGCYRRDITKFKETSSGYFGDSTTSIPSPVTLTVMSRLG